MSLGRLLLGALTAQEIVLEIAGIYASHILQASRVARSAVEDRYRIASAGASMVVPPPSREGGEYDGAPSWDIGAGAPTN